MAEEQAVEEAIVETDETTENEGEGQTPEQEAASTESKPVESPKEPTEEDIPVRPAASYIIERQKRTIERLRSKAEEDVEKDESPNDPIAERLDRIEQIALGQADDRELNDLFISNPDARKYEKRIRAYMGHDAYKAVPPEFIYRALSRDDAAIQADSKRKAADLEARQTRSVGSGIRDTRSRDKKTAEDIRNMTAEEFAEYDREQQRLARS